MKKNSMTIDEHAVLLAVRLDKDQWLARIRYRSQDSDLIFVHTPVGWSERDSRFAFTIESYAALKIIERIHAGEEVALPQVLLPLPDCPRRGVPIQFR